MFDTTGQTLRRARQKSWKNAMKLLGFFKEFLSEDTCRAHFKFVRDQKAGCMQATPVLNDGMEVEQR
ncbi:MAG: hypothetical protein RLZZ165_1199 [Bacteroidota bacterium]